MNWMWDPTAIMNKGLFFNHARTSLHQTSATSTIVPAGDEGGSATAPQLLFQNGLTSLLSDDLFAAAGNSLLARPSFNMSMHDQGSDRAHLQIASQTPVFDKGTDAMMFTGHDAVAPQAPALILVSDSVPNDTNTTKTLVVGAPATVGTIETIGDQDFYKVQLTAGQDYEFGMNAKTGGPNLVPLSDCYVEIYDAAGNLVVSGDGGAHTTLNNVNSGFDVLMTFTPETSGTYFVNARAFDQDGTNGTTGDFVGDYEVFARPAPAGAYHPYYDADSPLYSIDWGTQVDGTSRNPDGQEGPRVTDNAYTGTGYNPYGIEGKNVITYYFAKQGELYIDEDPTTVGTTETMVANGFSDWEKAAYGQAMQAYSNVADLVYVEVDNRAAADFVFITYNGTPGPGASLLGRMSPPDEENEGQSEFNALDERWTAQDLAPGGFSFTTLIHEMGHGHGLAHPHDNGGHSGIMHGVEEDGPAFSYTNGDYDLNQSIYTMMSYEDGWEKSPYGSAETTDGFGWLGSLMAFDVAAIQDKYGVNEDYHTGNNVYTLQDVNAPGTYYSCIWDAGGTDTILYGGGKDCTIDLRAATLQYEYGGGGWVSYAYGIFGGYTIANGVTIENATGGSGSDTLTGNDAANVLNGNGGADTMAGGAGNDIYYTNNAGDVVNELADGGLDTVLSLVDYTLGDNVERLTLQGSADLDGTGNALANRIEGNAGDNRLDGGLGADNLIGGAGEDHFVFASAPGAGNVDNILDFSVADDTIDLDRGVYTGLAHDGRLDLTAFALGTSALDADDRIIYDSASGNIWYDADGSGSGTAQMFAHVAAGTALTADHFHVF